MSTKILSVDDSRTTRLVIGRSLKPYDCQLCEASNGEEGLVVALREKPDLILLDITMPVMDGVEMLTRLRQQAELRATPVVMLTAESAPENLVSLARLGVRDYLVKPFTGEQLLEKIARVVPLEKIAI